MIANYPRKAGYIFPHLLAIAKHGSRSSPFVFPVDSCIGEDGFVCASIDLLFYYLPARRREEN